MFNTILGAGAASRYGSGSGSDQKTGSVRLRLRLRNTGFNSLVLTSTSFMDNFAQVCSVVKKTVFPFKNYDFKM
jgi:hypothetical protein